MIWYIGRTCAHCEIMCGHRIRRMTTFYQRAGTVRSNVPVPVLDAGVGHFGIGRFAPMGLPNFFPGSSENASLLGKLTPREMRSLESHDRGRRSKNQTPAKINRESISSWSQRMKFSQLPVGRTQTDCAARWLAQPISAA